MNKKVILEMNHISKDFSGVHALKDVHFEVYQGEIHALVGENGAGKSTLMKILSGIFPHQDYNGKLFLDGDLKMFSRPKDAEDAGIAIINQELMVLNQLSIAENIYLGHLESKNSIVKWNKIYNDARQVLRNLNMDIDVRKKVVNLGVGHKQLVEIAKAISQKRKILIMDEPTAALTDGETDQLFNVIRELNKKGMTIIYISHRMQEVFELADRISILRDGVLISTDEKKNLTHNKVVSLMVGREISQMYPNKSVGAGEELLRVDNFSVPSPKKNDRPLVRNVNISVKAGEIVGLSGLLGSGRTELVSAICGAYITKGSGDVYIRGERKKISNCKKGIKENLAFVTEDRKRSGLILESSILKNISLPSLKKVSKLGVLNGKKEMLFSKKQVDNLNIKISKITNKVSTLSGGNQQKTAIGKWLATNPKILILDEPTRGVDVGAKVEIYNIMRNLANSGIGILMVSSDLPEIIGMSDRIYVMHSGEITGELSNKEANEERIMLYATGYVD